MKSTKQAARLAGFLYLLLSILGIYGLLYVPSHLVVHGDAAATAHNILASETFYRSGIVADLISQALFMLVVLVLYRLLKGVDKTMAVLMLIWATVQVPISFLAEVHHLSVLTILDPAGPVAAFSEVQRVAQMSVVLDAYDNGIGVDEIFMGLWLFPFGWLVFKSGFLPRFLGVLLCIAGAAYFVEAVTWLLVPDYGHLVSKFAGPLRALELVTPLWLLILGAKDRPLEE
jgi:hypothetical protein